MISSICIFILVIVVVIALFYLYRKGKLLNLNAMFNKAKKLSEFNPTKFIIYDRSYSDSICDRLIIIDPFEWIIWCCRNELYIINLESVNNCGPNQTPAIQVNENRFTECCIYMNYDVLLEEYTKLEPHIVEYTISNNRFTIITALNILLDGYLTFDENKNMENIIVNHKELNSEELHSLTSSKLKRTETELIHHLNIHHKK